MSARAPGLAMHEGPFNHRLLLPLACTATVSLSEQVLLPILSHAMMYNISQRGKSQLTCILPCNQYRQAAAVRGRMGQECVLKPSNAEATLVQSTRRHQSLKTIWTLSCWYSLDSSWWVLSDEYPYARVSIIFQVFASFCNGHKISHQQHEGYYYWRGPSSSHRLSKHCEGGHSACLCVLINHNTTSYSQNGDLPWPGSQVWGCRFESPLDNKRVGLVAIKRAVKGHRTGHLFLY